MKRALIITYYWPPTSGSGVQRWLKMSKYLVKLGWQPVIYTPSNPEAFVLDPSLEKDIPAEAEIIKRPIVEPYDLYRKLLGKGKKGEVINPINDSGKKSLKEKLSLWIRANCFVPDPRVWWVNPSVRYLKKYLRKNPVDVIISSGPPHSMHLIGRRVSRAMNIRHIADFRDPWTTIYYYKHLPLWPLAKRKQRRMEGEVLFDADVVVSVTPQMTQEMKGLFLEYCEREGYLPDEKQKNKFHTICNGYDEDDYKNGEPVPEKSFCITFTGLLRYGESLDVLWKVLGQMCRESKQFQNQLVIKFAGKIDKEVLDGISKNGISGNVINLGYLPHNEITILQQRAWLLIIPIPNEPESGKILSGKVFEYLASNRPIFSIGPTDGELAKVLAETSTGDMAGWDDEKMTRDVIGKHYEKYKNGEWKFNSFKQEVEKYSRRKEAEEMAALMDL